MDWKGFFNLSWKKTLLFVILSSAYFIYATRDTYYIFKTVLIIAVIPPVAIFGDRYTPARVVSGRLNIFKGNARFLFNGFITAVIFASYLLYFGFECFLQYDKYLSSFYSCPLSLTFEAHALILIFLLMLSYFMIWGYERKIK